MLGTGGQQVEQHAADNCVQDTGQSLDNTATKTIAFGPAPIP